MIADLRPATLTKALAASLAVAALGLSACSTTPQQTPAAPPAASAPTTSAPETTAPATTAPPSSAAPSSTAPASPAPSSAADRLTITEAIEVALDTVDGAVVDVDTDDDGGTLVWEIDVRRSANRVAELRIDAATGKVLSNRNDNDVPDEARSSVPDTTAAQAVRIAERRIDGAAEQVDLGDEGATRTWQVTVRESATRSVEVTLNADSGAYLSQENDD